MSLLAIIDYGAGNLRSAAKAFAHVSADSGHEILVTADPADLARASHIVLPGVGAFADCMRGLRGLSGMIEAMEENVLHRRTPFLGICVGMQLLFERGMEHGEHAGLGWFKGTVRRIAVPEGGALKVPHMGWNELVLDAPRHPLFAGLPADPHAYFVHSYHATDVVEDEVLAHADYGGRIVSVVGRGHIMATQFHPEKSQEAGLCVLRNFLRLT